MRASTMSPRVFLLLLLFVRNVHACHNLCHGNGMCNIHSICECDPGFSGPDCSEKLCPTAYAWADTPDANGNAHNLAECSNRGTCDYTTGLCTCQSGFGGGACSILKCDNDCNNHGQCMSMKEAALQFNGFSLNRSVSYNLWDSEQIHGCVCDHGWEGHACTEQVCEKGDDPRTNVGVDEVVKLYCECPTSCTGNLVLRYKTNTFILSHEATASQFAKQLMALAYSKSDSSVYSQGAPVQVAYSAGTSVCSNGGTTSSITFKKESGALPSMDIMVNQLSSGGGAVVASFKTTQTLTCVCSGACGGSFLLSMDGIDTSDIAFNANAATLQTTLQNLYASINTAVTVNTVATTFSAGAVVCQDSSTVVSTIVFSTDSGNLPTLSVIASITDASVMAPNAMSVAHANRGSKDSLLCNGIGTCKYDTGKCDCGDYYTFEDAFGGCGRPIINTSAWVGVETCPGVVLQSDLTLAVDKPISEKRLYFAMGSNKTNTGLHYYATGGTFDLVPPTLFNLTNMTAGSVALDLSEGFVYFVDKLEGRIDRVQMYNVTKDKPYKHPYSGDLEFTRQRFAPDGGSAPYGLALDLRWHKRYAYWTVPSANYEPSFKTYGDPTYSYEDNPASGGKIRRCALDKGAAHLCTVEDLTTVIEAQVGELRNPRGIALDLVAEKMYWVDSGNETVADGKVFTANLDGTSAALLISQNLTDPYSIALDLVNSQIYIGDRRDHATQNYGAVGRVNMGNTTISWIVRWINAGSSPYDRVRNPDYLALDMDEGRIVFTDTLNRKIYWASMTEPWKRTGVFTGVHIVENPQGIAYDHGHGYPDASTPYYDCYGHGTCGGFASNFKCTCDDGYFGNCNNTMCPQGPAWFDEAVTENNAHRMAECSNRGTCIRRTGECKCQEGFSGGACERLDCPVSVDPFTSEELECSGRGTCQSVELMGFHRRNHLGEPAPIDYSYHAQTNKLWDAQMLQGCVCDVYWYTDGIWTHNLSDPMGYDCSYTSCPFGDNPNRPKTNTTLIQKFEMQALRCTASAGSFRIGFKGYWSNVLPFNVGVVDLEKELQSMRTFGNISVTYNQGDVMCMAGGNNIANVTFYSELGQQPLIKGDSELLRGGTIEVVQHVKGDKENEQCSNSGICDRTTGQCQCFNGYSSSDGNGFAGLRNDCGYFGDSRAAAWGENAWYGME
ncbi:hypothetical protein TrLO_g8835 [Triparma laevis f. longispina]|uniref:EGF-like domain-containing protein n=1 Tax=Triparma laevis f. longispina TaxID=1714387 RepID=A0A9W7A9R2_9STRA|nr:hypothetical protein TrLO_g8835 [Triparma laevis f. longispina]